MTVSPFSIPQLAGSDDRQYYIIRRKYSSSSNYIIGQMESKCNGLVCLAERGIFAEPLEDITKMGEKGACKVDSKSNGVFLVLLRDISS